jgi:hypothetical protein
MNLHDITSTTKAWVWLEAIGGNGRSLGTHLWLVVEDDIPPVLNEDRPVWANRDWTPLRYGWTPYNHFVNNIFHDGWVRPLCGLRSASRFAHANSRWTRSNCTHCQRSNRERGIMGKTFNEAVLANPTRQRLAVERDQWITNNR